MWPHKYILNEIWVLRFCYSKFFFMTFSFRCELLWMESWGLRGGARHLSDAVLESVMVFRLAAGAVAEVVVPLGLAKAGFLSGSTGVLGVVARKR